MRRTSYFNLRVFVILFLTILILSLVLFRSPQEAGIGEVHVYAQRHYPIDEKIFKLFEKRTGILVKVSNAGGAELIERLLLEGKSSPADLFYTSDVLSLGLAKKKGLLSPFDSDLLYQRVPEKMHDSDGMWFGLSKRARIFVYDPQSVSREELSTYDNLIDPRWKKSILVRGSNNLYNQGLLAFIIAQEGKTQALHWAEGIVKNFARNPKGGDRDQLRALAQGEGQLAIVNSYYVVNFANSKDPQDRALFEKLAVFFPNQKTSGTHINLSGIGLLKYSKNKENAQKLAEFLSSDEIQTLYSLENGEYPIINDIPLHPILENWGPFKEAQIDLNYLADYYPDVLSIFEQASWPS